MLRRLFATVTLFYSASAFAQTFPLPFNYENLSNVEKRDLLWANVLRTQYTSQKLPSLATNFNLAAVFSLIFLEESFDHTADEMPEGRVKFIHTYGSVAHCEYKPYSGSPYTGVLRGAPCLARISLAGNPGSLGIVPGMAVKFFIGGHPSANIHVMNSVDGQGKDTNVFARNFSNKIPPASGAAQKFLAKLFSLVKDDPNELPLDHLAVTTTGGKVEPAPVVADQLWFEPVPETATPSASRNDFRVDLAALSAPRRLYKVYAKGLEDDTPVPIGELHITSSFVASRYGDENLFFKHER